MPATSTITMSTTRGVSTHVISLTHGFSAAFFWCTLIGLAIYTVSFATTQWFVDGSTHIGLWESCSCNRVDRIDKSWFHATKAMMTIGLVGFIIVAILAFLYMFVHVVNKNVVITAFAVLCFVSAIFMLIGVIVFVSEIKDYSGHVSYSFVFAIFGTTLCLVAGTLSVCQICRSGSVTLTR